MDEIFYSTEVDCTYMLLSQKLPCPELPDTTTTVTNSSRPKRSRRGASSVTTENILDETAEEHDTSQQVCVWQHASFCTFRLG